jgi:hypothetical protein
MLHDIASMIAIMLFTAGAAMAAIALAPAQLPV